MRIYSREKQIQTTNHFRFRSAYSWKQVKHAILQQILCAFARLAICLLYHAGSPPAVSSFPFSLSLATHNLIANWVTKQPTRLSQRFTVTLELTKVCPSITEMKTQNSRNKNFHSSKFENKPETKTQSLILSNLIGQRRLTWRIDTYFSLSKLLWTNLK